MKLIDSANNKVIGVVMMVDDSLQPTSNLTAEEKALIHKKLKATIKARLESPIASR